MTILSLLGACASAPQGGDSGASFPAATSVGKTLVYECEDTDIVVRTGAGEVVVHTSDDFRVLPQVKTASGARYEDDSMMYWSKGTEAMFQVGDRRYAGCILNPARAPWEEARRRGVSFRALGQEPGWVLEIQPGRHMLMDADYGGLRVLVPAPESELTEGGERYESTTESHSLQVDIVLDTCADSMSGAVYTNRVTVNLDGRIFKGCGEALEPL
ncbi:MAG: MliC family protein [Pseudomonadota bacterium]